MGNCCGKSESDPFSQPGRPLGSAPPPASGTAPVPRKVGGPPRKLGGGSVSTGEGSTSEAADDARRRAAEAAEARAKGVKGGKLQSQLDAQKKQTRIETLKDASNQNLRIRDADENAETRNWA